MLADTDRYLSKVRVYAIMNNEIKEIKTEKMGEFLIMGDN